MYHVHVSLISKLVLEDYPVNVIIVHTVVIPVHVLS